MRKADIGSRAYLRTRNKVQIDAGEGVRTFYRAGERLFNVDAGWCFQTREGERGPYPSRDAAAGELTRYVETMSFLHEHRSKLPKDLNWDDVTLVEMAAPSCCAGSRRA